VGEWFEDVESLKQRKLTASEITVQFQGIARLDRPALGVCPSSGTASWISIMVNKVRVPLRLRPLLRPRTGLEEGRGGAHLTRIS